MPKYDPDKIINPRQEQLLNLEELFKTIKRLVPECEYTLVVFLNSKDYDDDDEENE